MFGDVTLKVYVIVFKVIEEKINLWGQIFRSSCDPDPNYQKLGSGLLMQNQGSRTVT